MRKKHEIHSADRFFSKTMMAAALLLALLLCLMGMFLLINGYPAFSKFGFNFITSTHWNPSKNIYGAAPVIFGTLFSSSIALLIACPISIAIALFLTELAPKSVSNILGFMVEMLAAIPSVVYGLWGVFVLTPWLRSSVQPFLSDHFPFLFLFQGAPYGIGMMAAAIILAIMIIPTISSISREVFKAIPIMQREAALALGATRWEMMKIAILKTSRGGLVGATILGLGRAIGETMAVTMVIGNRNKISWSLFDPGQTMASIIANEYAEATSEMHLSALAAVGFLLFVVTFVLNSVAKLFVWRVRGAK